MHTLITYAAPPGPRCREALSRLELPHLARLLHTLCPGQRLQGQESDLIPVHERVLAQAAGLDGADGLVPWAAQDALRLGLTGLHGLEGWAWITPCHWQVHGDHVEMASPHTLALTPRDAEALYLAMQPYFAEDGITLFAQPLGHTPLRWLAHGAVFKDLPTASLDRVAGHTVDGWMPRQAQAQPLRRLQNEMQMLLYTHPVNDQRAKFRQPAVNAFWASGTGTPKDAAALLQPPASVSVRDALRQPALQDDAAAWSSAWQALDATTLAHALERLHHGEDERLTLCSETRAVALEPGPPGTWERLKRRVLPLRPTDLLQTL